MTNTDGNQLLERRSVDDGVIEPRLGILLDHPSPHMLALLEAFARRDDVLPRVVYLNRGNPARNWPADPGPLPHTIVRETPAGGLARAIRWARARHWVVGSVYTAAATWRAVSWLRAARQARWLYLNEPPRPRGRLADRAKRAVLRRLTRDAVAVATTGRGAVPVYQDILGHQGRVVSVPYYLDVEAFLSVEPVCATDHGQGEGAFTSERPLRLGCLGQLTGRKGHDVLLAALRRLPPEGWELHIIGDGPALGSLQRLALDARAPVSFHDAVSYRQRHEAFAGFDVLVVPSRFDGWGMVVPEALAAGRAVVATDQVMAGLELIEEGGNGHVVPAGDAEALSRCLARLLADRSRVRALCRNARRSLAGWCPDEGAQTLVDCLELTGARTAAASGRRALPLATTDGFPHAGQETTLTVLRRSLGEYGIRSRLRAGALSALGRLVSRPATKGGRILAYHFVHPAARTVFAEHLAYLRAHFELVTVGELVARKARGDSLDEYLAVSFDDGFAQLLPGALRCLERQSVCATFYVPTRYVGLADSPEKEALWVRYRHGHGLPLRAMSPGDLRALAGAGHEIGSHGRDHLAADELTEAGWRQELESARESIESWLGARPAGFAFPYGVTGSRQFDPSAAVEAAGYRYAVTMRRGKLAETAGLFALPREHVEGHWPLSHLRAFLGR